MTTRADDRPSLVADCANCFGLCCVALPFAKSADFAYTKPAGVPCRNLLADFRCGIHAELGERGFSGCSTFDCFGAGQLIAQHTFEGTSWREAPDTSAAMFESFPVVRALHEMRWYLECALTIEPALGPEVDAMTERLVELATGDADALRAVDLDAERSRVNPLLARASTASRSRGARGADLKRVPRGPGADLIAAKLGGADLRGAELRGAYLIGALLRDADLGSADVIGADFRGADVRGARLADAIYLTQFQVNSARGDGFTTLPPTLTRPGHWRDEIA